MQIFMCQYINKYELYSSIHLCFWITFNVVLFATIMLEPRIRFAPILLGNPCRMRLNPALCILNLVLTASFTNSKTSLKSFNFNNCSEKLIKLNTSIVVQTEYKT